jgi:hypothetical protein
MYKDSAFGRGQWPPSPFWGRWSDSAASPFQARRGGSTAAAQSRSRNADIPVFAMRLLPSGQWEMIGPVAHDLTYRYGLRRIAQLGGGDRW